MKRTLHRMDVANYALLAPSIYRIIVITYIITSTWFESIQGHIYAIGIVSLHFINIQ